MFWVVLQISAAKPLILMLGDSFCQGLKTPFKVCSFPNHYLNKCLFLTEIEGWFSSQSLYPPLTKSWFSSVFHHPTRRTAKQASLKLAPWMHVCICEYGQGASISTCVHVCRTGSELATPTHVPAMPVEYHVFTVLHMNQCLFFPSNRPGVCRIVARVHVAQLKPTNMHRFVCLFMS